MTRIAFATILIGSVLVVGCSKDALTDANVVQLLTKQQILPLSPDRVAVKGISTVSQEAIAKVDLDGTTVNVKFRHYDRGWVPEQVETRGGTWLAIDTALGQLRDERDVAERRAERERLNAPITVPPAPLRLVKRVEPLYPPIAQSAHISGIVVLNITVAPDGHVSNATVVKSLPLFDQAAIDAVQRWRYEPPSGGQPISFLIEVAFINR